MSATDQDLHHLRHAIDLASAGRFAVAPNPMVGCVIVRDGAVVGEGAHLAYGGAHAEIAALREAGDDAREATVYVSLEPCARVGKTGACSDALRAAGVSRVLYAAADPAMAGAGPAALKAAGVEVAGPLLPEESAPLLRHFLAAQRRPRPWVVLKWAMSLDGRIALEPGRGGAISGSEAKAFVHDLRAHVDAVAVGVETVVIDDPRLTCRSAGGPPDGRPQPTRVVFDTGLRMPLTARMVTEVGEAPVVVVSAGAAPSRRVALASRGVEVLSVAAGREGVDLDVALERLYEHGIRRLLVEGGARIHGAFLAAGLADQVTVIVAPKVVGRSDVPTAVEGAIAACTELREPRWRSLGEDVLLQGYVR